MRSAGMTLACQAVSEVPGGGRTRSCQSFRFRNQNDGDTCMHQVPFLRFYTSDIGILPNKLPCQIDPREERQRVGETCQPCIVEKYLKELTAEINDLYGTNGPEPQYYATVVVSSATDKQIQILTGCPWKRTHHPSVTLPEEYLRGKVEDICELYRLYAIEPFSDPTDPDFAAAKVELIVHAYNPQGENDNPFDNRRLNTRGVWFAID